MVTRLLFKVRCIILIETYRNLSVSVQYMLTFGTSFLVSIMQKPLNCKHYKTVEDYKKDAMIRKYNVNATADPNFDTFHHSDRRALLNASILC